MGRVFFSVSMCVSVYVFHCRIVVFSFFCEAGRNIAMLKLVLYALSHTIVKGKKVNLSICLIKYLAIKTWRYGSTILNPGTRWRSTSHLCHLTSRKIDCGIHCIGDWQSPRVSVDANEREQSLASVGNHILIPQSSSL